MSRSTALTAELDSPLLTDKSSIERADDDTLEPPELSEPEPEPSLSEPEPELLSESDPL